MNLKKLIDHTYLKAEGTKREIDNLIAEANKYGFGQICINSSWIKYAKSQIKNDSIGIVSVVGFPLGANITQSKVYETKLSIDHGALEIDMVINIGKLKEGNFEYVLNEIKKIKEECGNKILKVIIETALLTKAEIKEATKIVLQSGADFIKTSTGFSYRGASFEDIEIFNEILKGSKVQIKAAGGIKTFEDLEKYYNLGVRRFGTSSSVSLFEGKEANDY